MYKLDLKQIIHIFLLYFPGGSDSKNAPTFENCVLTRDAVVPATPCPDPAVHNSIIWMG